jgi:HD-GYP domain-containing protein (c-di-GMP phosphodiesterase class II)
MPVRLNIRFQHWVLATTFALVLLLTGIFLLTVLGKFTSMSEENAQERFSLVAQRAAAETNSLIRETGRFVTTQASAEPRLFSDAGSINTKDMAATLISSLAGDPNLYGHFFGLDNDEFLQVIGVRDNAKIIAALNAPAGTFFAIRHIIRQTDSKRLERWQFLDKQRQTLGSREAEASYAPSGRPWFVDAKRQASLSLTAPYLFSSTGELGLTVSAPLADGRGVFGSDINLGALDLFLSSLSLTPNAAIMVIDNADRVLAYHGQGSIFAGLNIAPLTALEAVPHSLFQSIKATRAGSDAQVLQLGQNNQQQGFVLARLAAEPFPTSRFDIIALAPVSDFTGPIERARIDVLLVSLATLLVLVPLALVGTRRVVRALSQLASDSEMIKQFNFSVEPRHPESILYEINTLGEAQIVMQHSIKARTAELNLAQEKLARLVENGLLLAKEQDRNKLLRHILMGARDIAHCAAGTLYLKTERNTLSFAMRTNSDDLPNFEVPLYHPETGKPMDGYVSSHVALNNKIVIIDDVYSETRFDLSGTKRFSEESGFRTVSMLTVPLSPRDGEVIGVIQLMNALDPDTGEVIPFTTELISFIEALAAQSAVTLENLNLLEAQKVLMDSMIKIIAGAIDAKSAYTGGHCERVPELAVMLAQEAQKVEEGPLAEFRFNSDDEWREFRIGAWLHDCGKVTTPEFVVDKATKLETIYNRIHEIRTRFEILLRDAQIARFEAIASGTPEADADAELASRHRQLLDDFAFVAECNIGGEFMAPDKMERIRQIAAQTWLRHFDDRLGLSHEELRRCENTPAADLPALETLLADKPWHIIPRTDFRALDPKHGFKLKVPEHLYNFGELYNMGIARGTLTEEERFKINEHIIQTIVMLDSMPFPKHLKRVPEYAGTHHETLLGSGYPRQLSAAELSIPSRIMAIADIFEALTASDRPYKKAKTLSESVKILSFFKKDKHIDADLFDLFLTSGIYKRYGESFLKPEQIDDVEIAKFIG